MTKPMLLIDVDGPLNPWANSSNQTRKNKRYHRYKIDGYVVWLNRWHGSELKKLPYELVWCTTWEHDANTMIGPRIGLPKLPVIEWDQARRPDTDRMPDGTYWKTPQVVEYAAGRPFAWVDDEIRLHDLEYAKEHHAGACNLMPINPTTGLTEEHFAALAEWADTLALMEDT